MSENVPTSGFSVPPVPAQATQSGTPRPDAGNMQPGFVPQVPAAPVAPAGLSAEQVQEQIALALKAAQPQAPAAPTPVPSFSYSNDGTGDPVTNSLTDVFLSVGSGIDLDRAIGNALSLGNPALIDLAYINEKGGANAAQLATLAKAIVERVQSQTAASAASVHAAAGGKAQWDTAAAVFSEKAPKYMKAVIAQMMNSGDNEAIQAAAKSVVDYVQSNGFVAQPAQLLHAGASSANPGQALSKYEFQEAHSKLDTNSRNYLAERDALFARRALGKQLGK